MNVLERYEELKREVNKFYNENREEIITQKNKRYKKRVLDKLPKILKEGNMIWCRNGSVCYEATPCDELECIYKKNKKDVVNGCSECKLYQITNKCNSWGNTCVGEYMGGDVITTDEYYKGMEWL